MTNKRAVGRPTVKNKKVPLAMRVSPEIKAWLALQEESAGNIVEALLQKVIKSEMKKAIKDFNNAN